MKPAIVLGTHTMGLAVIRSLGMMGIPVVAVYYDRRKDMGYVSKYVKYTVYAPHPEREEEEFLELLLGCSSRFGGGLLIPVSDEALVAVSRHKDLLASHYTVACTEWEITRRLIDKKYSYTLAESAGVAVPKTIILQSMVDVEYYGKIIEYPCLVKPCQSHIFFSRFGKKMIPVDNFKQMVSVYQQAVDAGMDVMLQEIIPGEDDHVVNYNSYFWDGKPLVEFTAQQIRKAPPEFGSPCIAVSKKIPEVMEPGRRILEAMGFYGYSCTEFKKDSRDGVYKFMEVNGRHNLSTLLAVNCGINFPWLHYSHLMYGMAPMQTKFLEDIYWVDMERDLPCIPRRIFRQKESLAQIFEPYIHQHISAVYDSHDLRPFIKRYVDFGNNVVSRLLKHEQ